MIFAAKKKKGKNSNEKIIHARISLDLQGKGVFDDRITIEYFGSLSEAQARFTTATLVYERFLGFHLGMDSILIIILASLGGVIILGLIIIFIMILFKKQKKKGKSVLNIFKKNFIN